MVLNSCVQFQVIHVVGHPIVFQSHEIQSQRGVGIKFKFRQRDYGIHVI
jgi:hypothetical protein